MNFHKNFRCYSDSIILKPLQNVIYHIPAIEIQLIGYEKCRGYQGKCYIERFQILPLNLLQRSISFGRRVKYSVRMNKIACKSDIEITLSSFQS